ncbi:MAG: hypothetical protein ACKVX7_10550 [Planctomycetota bacterium]
MRTLCGWTIRGLRRVAGLGVVGWILCAEALAQTPATPLTAPDFRGKVTLAYGSVLTLVVVFLLLSIRRQRAMAEDLKFLEQRIAAMKNERQRSNQ